MSIHQFTASGKDKRCGPDGIYAWNKWAAIAFKGGCCEKCGNIFTRSNMLEAEFDHIVPLRMGTGTNDRWSGPWRAEKPFTAKWKAWLETVRLVCWTCHRGKKQMALDWGAQDRMDSFWEANAR